MAAQYSPENSDNLVFIQPVVSGVRPLINKIFTDAKSICPLSHRTYNFIDCIIFAGRTGRCNVTDV